MTAPDLRDQMAMAALTGPVEKLCREIGFPWDRRLEREDVFVAFVGELVEEVAQRLELSARLVGVAGNGPTDAALRALDLARSMVSRDLGLDVPARTKLATALHDLSHETNPEDGPCGHDVDMLASCASAIRFGLERPCHSRHAAAAAQHVWQHVYVVSRFDSNTPEWERSWARGKLTSALISLLPADAMLAQRARSTQEEKK